MGNLEKTVFGKYYNIIFKKIIKQKINKQNIQRK